MTGRKAPIAFLFPAFPVLHQTFVLWEVLALRRHGVPIALYSIKRPSTTTQQPEAVELAREVTYLPSSLSWPVLRANLRIFLRAPLRYLRVFARLMIEWWRDRHVADMWRDPSARRDPAAHMATARQRLQNFYNQSAFFYLLKTLWLVIPSVYLGTELEAAGIRRVHAHWASYPATMALVIKWLFDIPYSFTAHAYDLYLVPQFVPVKVRTAEFVVTCARVNAKYLEAMAGPSAPHRIVVNYHGVDLDKFQPRAALPLPEQPCIVTCGRLQLYKGHHVLLQACALLERPVRCIVIGEGPLRTRFEELAQSLGIRDRVEFTGPLPQREVARLYGQADVFVLASVVIENTGKRDVIPNVLAEAMAMQVPVVATNVSGIAELVTDGVSGRLVPPNDPRALAAVLDELLRDAPQRQRLALAGYHKVVADFDRSANIPTLAALFLDGEVPVARPVHATTERSPTAPNSIEMPSAVTRS